MFEANAHSEWLITWRKVSEDTERTIRNVLMNGFGFERVLAVSQVCEWERMSNNFSIRCMFEGAPMEVLLRKNIRLSDISAITTTQEIMIHLAESGVPVPRILSGVSGNTVFLQGGSFWEVFEFVSGNHFRGTEEELIAAACCVAKVHRALEQMGPLGHVEGTDTAVFTDNDFADLSLLTIEKAGDNPLGALVEETTPYFVERLRDVQGRLSSMVLRRQAVHRDIHPQNFIFRDGVLRAVLDFGNVGVHTLMSDVGNACHRLVRQAIVFQKLPWRGHLRRLVNLFLDEYEGENSLTNEERSNLHLFAAELLLQKLYGNMELYRDERRPASEAKAELIKFRELLLEAESIGDCV